MQATHLSLERAPGWIWRTVIACYCADLLAFKQISKAQGFSRLLRGLFMAGTALS